MDNNDLACGLQEEEEKEDEEEKCSINLELERRAIKAEEEARQKDDDVQQKEEEIAALRQQVEHYESRLSECELKMRSVEEELQKQIAALQLQVTKSVIFPRLFLAPKFPNVRVADSSTMHARMSCSRSHVPVLLADGSRCRDGHRQINDDVAPSPRTIRRRYAGWISGHDHDSGGGIGGTTAS